MIRVRVTDPILTQCDGVRMTFEGTPTFVNRRVEVILNAVPMGTCNQNIKFVLQLKSTGTNQVLKIVNSTLDFSGAGNRIVVFRATVDEATINGEIFATDPSTGFTLGRSNKLTFQVQEGVTPPSTTPPSEPPTTTPSALGNIDKIVMGALIAGAILPFSRGKKK